MFCFTYKINMWCSIMCGGRGLAPVSLDNNRKGVIVMPELLPVARGKHRGSFSKALGQR
jgi:hypothetical protein